MRQKETKKYDYVIVYTYKDTEKCEARSLMAHSSYSWGLYGRIMVDLSSENIKVLGLLFNTTTRNQEQAEEFLKKGKIEFDKIVYTPYTDLESDKYFELNKLFPKETRYYVQRSYYSMNYEVLEMEFPVAPWVKTHRKYKETSSEARKELREMVDNDIHDARNKIKKIKYGVESELKRIDTEEKKIEKLIEIRRENTDFGDVFNELSR